MFFRENENQEVFIDGIYSTHWFCVDSSPKKSSKKTPPKPSPRKEDSGKYKSAEFVETDESSSEDQKTVKKLKRNKKEVVKCEKLCQFFFANFLRWL